MLDTHTRHHITAALGFLSSFSSVLLDSEMTGRNKKTCLHNAGMRREGGGELGRREDVMPLSAPENAIYVIQCSPRKQKESTVMWRRPLPPRTPAHYSSFL